MSENTKAELIETGKNELVPISATGQMFLDRERLDFGWKVANILTKSDLVPQHFHGKPENCMIALNFAERAGLDPFMVMQRLYVIAGKPGIETQLALAMFNNAGRFSPIKYRMNDDKSACIAYATEKASGEIFEGPEVTLKMATAEGWASKAGSKWKTMPEVMLRYRSAIFFIRTYAPEVLLGMMTKEEIEETVKGPAQQHKETVIKEQEDRKAQVQASVDKALKDEFKEVDEAEDVQKKPKAYADYKLLIENLKKVNDIEQLKQFWPIYEDKIKANLPARSVTLLKNHLDTILMRRMLGPEANRAAVHIEPENLETDNPPPLTADEFIADYKALDKPIDCSRYYVKHMEEIENLPNEEHERVTVAFKEHDTFLKQVAEQEAKNG